MPPGRSGNGRRRAVDPGLRSVGQLVEAATERVLVIGAGVVGVCCGIALAEAGYQVRLLGRELPGRGASRWNAGVLATSSIVPLSRPGVVRSLPALLLGRSAGFRLNPRAARHAIGWGRDFVRASRVPSFEATVDALDALIGLSIAEHGRLLADSRATALLSERGWLFLFETEAQFAAASTLRETLARHGVGFETTDAAGLADLEPHLARRFARAMWLTGSKAVTEPAAVLVAYLAHFRSLGGAAETAEAIRIEPDGRRAGVRLADGRREVADHLVVAAGAWSAGLLASLGLRLPLMSERGYVRRFPLAPGARLNRPVYDIAGGLVLAPRPEGVQLSTGTELTLPGLPGRDRQREPAARRAAAILPLGAALPGFDADADRPTLPDCRPAIGRLAGPGSLWLCCGHQHIGFSTAPGSALLLAALMRKGAPPIAPEPFAPSRFGL
jgi:D-amino-acid dehydrogenase